MKIKKILALALAAVMTISVAACGSSSDSSSSSSSDSSSSSSSSTDSSSSSSSSSSSTATRIINIGTWWVQYYDSDDELTDSSDYTTALANDDEFNLNIALLKWDNVSTIEEKYNVKYYWQNLTYSGVQESINTSILAGTPDCDIYLVDLGMAIPAQLNGLALDLTTVLPEDADVFTTQNNVTYLNLGDGKVCILKRVEAQSTVEATYPLGFNIQMLEDAGLEDPRDLYERGEWTWDKFIEYCQVLTQDTDGDGQIDQYGYCGYEYETLEQLMMSNGGNIAAGTTETLTSNAVGEALQMIYDMYNTYNVCYPYDYDGSPSDSMRNQYTQGNVAFFPIAAWISSGNNDYDYNGDTGVTLSFDIAYVRWPVGPSGDQETNAGKVSSGEYYIIPVGVEDPETVYNVLYDYWNWYDDDTSIRDDKSALNWWYGVTAKTEELQNANFDVMFDCGMNETFDLWNSLSIGYDIQSLIKGETTAAQFQETYKQEVQDALDSYFG